jgi:hypothetical protein
MKPVTCTPVYKSDISFTKDAIYVFLLILKKIRYLRTAIIFNFLNYYMKIVVQPIFLNV